MPNPLHQKNIVHGSITAGGDVRIGDDYITYHNYFAAQEVKIPHRLTNNIPTNSDHILGRSTELAQAKDYLAQNQATILFNGIGGIGKTALASKYMAIYGSEYSHLAWITVQSTLAEAFINNTPLLASLKITQQVQDYIEAKQLDKAFEYLFHQLNLLERTLVVIDNANDLDDLDQYKNWFDTANCHFLITSRSQPSEWATVEVDSLPEDEAVALFRKLHPSVSADDEAIKNLLSKLFYHTLLIELVAKAGASTGIAFADLQTMIEIQFIHHQSLNEAPVPTGKHGSVVATNLRKAKIEDYIWLIFSNLKDLDKKFKHLLKAMALLPVATPFDLEFLKAHFELLGIKDVLPALSGLVERGWLQKEQDDESKVYFKIHPLIADMVVKQLEVDVYYADIYIKHMADLIYYSSADPDNNLFKKKQYIPLTDRLVYLFFLFNTEGVSLLLHRLNWYNQQYGFYEKALLFGERALQITENLPTIDEITLSRRQNDLALLYRDLGHYKKAASLFEQALASDIKNFGVENPYVAIAQSNLALVYIDLCNYEAAADLLEQALASDIKNFGPEHPNSAIRQSNLALVYQNLGDYAQAGSLLEQALASAIKSFGVEHPTIAIRRSRLAKVYIDLGRNIEAAVLAEQALASDIKNFGQEHPSVASSQNTLALVYNKLGRVKEAQALFQQSYQTYLKAFGAEHPYIQIAKGFLI